MYGQAAVVALNEQELRAEYEVPTPGFRGRVIGDFRADIVVDGSVILELEAVRRIDCANEKQILNYLESERLTCCSILELGRSSGDRYSKMKGRKSAFISVRPRRSRFGRFHENRIRLGFARV